MMPKQLPDMSQDPGAKEDAAAYASSIIKKLKVSDVEQSIINAYLAGAKNGFCTGYRCSDIEAEKEYSKVINELKKQLREKDKE